jgi:hypothetical protein
MSLGILLPFDDGGVAIHADLERVEADAADGFDETLAVEALGPVARR